MLRSVEMPVISMITTARCLLVIGGGILLLQSLGGLFAVLMFGFDSILEVTTALCLTLAFPIYLVGFRSLRYATWLLWTYFALQWLNACFISSPPQLLNPFEPHGAILFVSIAFVQMGYLIISRVSDRRIASNLCDLFAGTD